MSSLIAECTFHVTFESGSFYPFRLYEDFRRFFILTGVLRRDYQDSLFDSLSKRFLRIIVNGPTNFLFGRILTRSATPIALVSRKSILDSVSVGLCYVYVCSLVFWTLVTPILGWRWNRESSSRLERVHSFRAMESLRTIVNALIL